MAASKKIILILFLGSSLSIFADEPKFPDIGLLYISGLGCDKDSSTEAVPKESIQYFLTSDSFYKLTVTDDFFETTTLPYPDVNWLKVINNLPDKPPGCSVGIAIQNSSLSTAKYAMKRFKVNAGKIHKENEVYY